MQISTRDTMIWLKLFTKKRFKLNTIGSSMNSDVDENGEPRKPDIIHKIASIFSRIGIVFVILSVVLVFFQRRPGSKFWPKGAMRLLQVFQVVIQKNNKNVRRKSKFERF